MYLINHRKLAGDLASRHLTEFDALKYYAVGTALAIFNQQSAAAFAPNGPALFALECAILVVSSFAGIAHCWQRNGGKAGSDFVLRMVCLSVPVGIRMTLLSALFGAAMAFSTGVFYDGFFANPYRAQVIVSQAAFIGLLVYFWNAMGQAVLIAATTTDRTAQ